MKNNFFMENFKDDLELDATAWSAESGWADVSGRSNEAGEGRSGNVLLLQSNQLALSLGVGVSVNGVSGGGSGAHGLLGSLVLLDAGDVGKLRNDQESLGSLELGDGSGVLGSSGKCQLSGVRWAEGVVVAHHSGWKLVLWSRGAGGSGNQTGESSESL